MHQTVNYFRSSVANHWICKNHFEWIRNETEWRRVERIEFVHIYQDLLFQAKTNCQWGNIDKWCGDEEIRDNEKLDSCVPYADCEFDLGLLVFTPRITRRVPIRNIEIIAPITAYRITNAKIPCGPNYHLFVILEPF